MTAIMALSWIYVLFGNVLAVQARRAWDSRFVFEFAGECDSIPRVTATAESLPSDLASARRDDPRGAGRARDAALIAHLELEIEKLRRTLVRPGFGTQGAPH